MKWGLDGFAGVEFVRMILLGIEGLYVLRVDIFFVKRHANGLTKPIGVISAALVEPQFLFRVFHNFIDSINKYF